MYTHLSTHRMSLPPPPAGYLDAQQPSGLMFVSKIVIGAIATAIAAAFIIAAPPTVIVPIAVVFTAGVIGSLAAVAIDRNTSAGRPQSQRPPRLGSDGAALASEQVGPGVVVGLTSLVFLLFALVSPVALRVWLAAAGLLGIAGVRVAAADAAWVRRGSAWTTKRRQQPLA